MKLTKKRISEINEAFTLLIPLGFEENRITYWTGKILKKITPIAQALEEHRNKLITEVYGIQEGTMFSVPKDKMEEYMKDFHTEADSELDVEIPEFKLKDFDKCFIKDKEGKRFESFVDAKFFALMDDLVKES